MGGKPRDDDRRQRDADIRELLDANCPPDEICAVVRDVLRHGGRVILPCTCAAMITTRLDHTGSAVVSHYATTGKYEASTTIPRELFGTRKGSRMLHEWIDAHHKRPADQIGPE